MSQGCGVVMSNPSQELGNPSVVRAAEEFNSSDIESDPDVDSFIASSPPAHELDQEAKLDEEVFRSQSKMSLEIITKNKRVGPSESQNWRAEFTQLITNRENNVNDRSDEETDSDVELDVLPQTSSLPVIPPIPLLEDLKNDDNVNESQSLIPSQELLQPRYDFNQTQVTQEMEPLSLEMPSTQEFQRHLGVPSPPSSPRRTNEVFIKPTFPSATSRIMSLRKPLSAINTSTQKPRISQCVVNNDIFDQPTQIPSDSMFEQSTEVDGDVFGQVSSSIFDLATQIPNENPKGRKETGGKVAQCPAACTEPSIFELSTQVPCEKAKGRKETGGKVAQCPAACTEPSIFELPTQVPREKAKGSAEVDPRIFLEETQVDFNKSSPTQIASPQSDSIFLKATQVPAKQSDSLSLRTTQRLDSIFLQATQLASSPPPSSSENTLDYSFVEPSPGAVSKKGKASTPNVSRIFKKSLNKIFEQETQVPSPIPGCDDSIFLASTQVPPAEAQKVDRATEEDDIFDADTEIIDPPNQNLIESDPDIDNFIAATQSPDFLDNHNCNEVLPADSGLATSSQAPEPFSQPSYGASQVFGIAPWDCDTPEDVYVRYRRGDSQISTAASQTFQLSKTPTSVANSKIDGPCSKSLTGIDEDGGEHTASDLEVNPPVVTDPRREEDDGEKTDSDVEEHAPPIANNVTKVRGEDSGEETASDVEESLPPNHLLPVNNEAGSTTSPSMVPESPRMDQDEDSSDTICYSDPILDDVVPIERKERSSEANNTAAETVEDGEPYVEGVAQGESEADSIDADYLADTQVDPTIQARIKSPEQVERHDSHDIENEMSVESADLAVAQVAPSAGIETPQIVEKISAKRKARNGNCTAEPGPSARDVEFATVDVVSSTPRNTQEPGSTRKRKISPKKGERRPKRVKKITEKMAEFKEHIARKRSDAPRGSGATAATTNGERSIEEARVVLTPLCSLESTNPSQSSCAMDSETPDHDSVISSAEQGSTDRPKEFTLPLRRRRVNRILDSTDEDSGRFEPEPSTSRSLRIRGDASAERNERVTSSDSDKLDSFLDDQAGTSSRGRNTDDEPSCSRGSDDPPRTRSTRSAARTATMETSSNAEISDDESVSSQRSTDSTKATSTTSENTEDVVETSSRRYRTRQNAQVSDDESVCSRRSVDSPRTRLTRRALRTPQQGGAGGVASLSSGRKRTRRNAEVSDDESVCSRRSGDSPRIRLTRRTVRTPQQGRVASSSSGRNTTRRNAEVSDDESVCSRKSSNSRRTRSSAPCVAFAMVNTDRRIRVRKLGGRVVELEDATVYVCEKFTLTVDDLYAIGKGLPIVPLKWLTACEKSKKWLDPWEHLVKDARMEKKWRFDLKESLRMVGTKKFLDGYTVYVTENVSPSSVEIIRIAEVCGACATATKPKNWTNKTIVVSCPEDETLWPSRGNRQVSIINIDGFLRAIVTQQLIFSNDLLR